MPVVSYSLETLDKVACLNGSMKDSTEYNILRMEPNLLEANHSSYRMLTRNIYNVFRANL